MMPDPNNVLEMEQRQVALRTYEDEKCKQKKIMKRAFTVVIGQCLEPIQNWMENHAKLQQIYKESNVTELLKLILESMV